MSPLPVGCGYGVFDRCGQVGLLIKELWAFTGDRIAVRFAYEWHDDSDHWHRSYGNEHWEFTENGLMTSRFASINDLPIWDSERRYHWPLGRRPEDTKD